MYEVDMRLRPSGKQGPVATSLQSFREYQSTEAWTWEHLALTRARPLAGAAAVMDDVEDFRASLIARKRDRQTILNDVAEMRRRLEAAKPAKHGLDVRAGPGRLQDIELFAQTAALLSGSEARRLAEQLPWSKDVFGLSDAEAGGLADAAVLYWRVQAALRLVFGEAVPGEVGLSATAFLLKHTGCADLKQLETHLTETANSVAAVIARCLAVAPE